MTIQENTNDHYQRYWDYLHILARMQMGPQFAGKLDISGIVQQTLWEAFAAHQQISPLDEARRVAFLRRIMVNNMKDEIRKFSTAARDIARELSLEAIDASSQRLAALIAAEQSSPSEAVLREERAIRLADAMAALPEQQRVAIEMHHLQGMKLSEVAKVLNRSKGAVAALLARGMKQLRATLKES